MALNYITSPGGLFCRLGKFFDEQNRVVSSYGSSLNSGVSDVYDQYPVAIEEGQDISPLLGSTESYRGVHSTYLASLTSMAQNTVTDQVNREIPLATKTFPVAVAVLADLMETDGETINRPTTSMTTTPWGSNKGNAVLVTSLTNQYGEPLDMVFAEDITTFVTADVSSGGTQYAETLQAVGEPTGTATNYLWPLGSGCNTTFRITNGAVDTLVQDGNFELWSGITPTKWTVVTGPATVDKGTTNLVRGTYNMEWTSDGSTLTRIRQQLSTSVAPNTVYCLNLWAIIDTLDVSGIVRFRLTDTDGTTLVNDNGDSLTYNRNVNGQIGTSLTNVYQFFQTGRQLPPSGGVWLDIAYTTSPATSRVLQMAMLSLVAATQLYPGGPYAAAFSYTTSNARGDYYTSPVANNLATKSFVRTLDRWFNMRTQNLYLPSSTSPTIPDSLMN